MNSAAGSFGLSFGLAFAGAIMLAALSLAFTHMADDSAVLSPAEQQQVADRAGGRRRGDEQHPARGAARRPARRTSRPRSSASTPTPDRSRCRSPCSIPILAGLLGLVNSFRMLRLPDPAPSASTEGVVLG